MSPAPRKTTPKKASPVKAARQGTSLSNKGADAVGLFLQQAVSPVKEIVREARVIILQSAALTEQIKWNAPSFCADGDDRITFHVGKKGDVMLIFHLGARAKDRKGRGNLIEDASGLLEWASPDRAILRLPDAAFVKSHAKQLNTLVRQWIAASVR